MWVPVGRGACRRVAREAVPEAASPHCSIAAMMSCAIAAIRSEIEGVVVHGRADAGHPPREHSLAHTVRLGLIHRPPVAPTSADDFFETPEIWNSHCADA